VANSNKKINQTSMATQYNFNFKGNRMFILLLALFLIFQTQSKAQQSPFNCESPAYLFQYNDVYSVDLASGNSYLVASNITSGNINAAAYNSADGYLWGALSTPDQSLVRISNDFSTTIYTIDELPSNNPYVGDISPSGMYYLKPGGTTYHIIDLDPNSPQYLEYAGSGTLSQNLSIHDWAFNAVDNKLYTVEKGSNHLFTIDPQTGSVTDMGEVPVLAGSNNTYGAVYFDAAGNFYVSANQTGTIFIIYDVKNITSGSMASNIFAYGPSSASNDGARCPTAPVAQENCSNGIDDDGDGLVDCDDPACNGVEYCPDNFTSGGNEGGLESNNRLSQLINKRNYGKIKNDSAFDLATAPRIRKGPEYGRKSPYRNNDFELISFIPQGIFEEVEVVESSPEDLLNITNATEVLSVDYMKEDVRQAAILALKTEESVYEHTKYICDRLLGAELLSVSTIELNQHNFIRSIIRRPNGKTEFVVSFSASVEEDGFAIESHWNIDSYSNDTGFYNFQIWTGSMEDLQKLCLEILALLNVQQPIVEYRTSSPPPVFVKKAFYQQGKITLDIVNNNFTDTITIEGGLKRTETEEEEVFNAATNIDPYQSTLQIETSSISDMGFRIYGKVGATPDDLFIADGPWGIDDSDPASTVSVFNVTAPDNQFHSEGFPLERNAHIEASLGSYVSVYRAFNPRFNAVDLTGYNTFSFDASGNGKLEVILISEDIEAWEDQYRTTILLNKTSKRFSLSNAQFISKTGKSPDWSKLKMVVFSMQAAPGVTEDKTLDLANLEFSHKENLIEYDILEAGGSNIFPNPVTAESTLYFFSSDPGTFDLMIFTGTGQQLEKRSGGEAIGGVNFQPVSSSGLLPGVYFYSIVTSAGDFHSGKIIVP
jgi:hypothetical protein